MTRRDLLAYVKVGKTPYPHPDEARYLAWIHAHHALDSQCALPLAERVLEVEDTLEAVLARTQGGPVPWKRDHECEWCGKCVTKLWTLVADVLAEKEGRYDVGEPPPPGEYPNG